MGSNALVDNVSFFTVPEMEVSGVSVGDAIGKRAIIQCPLPI